MKYIPSYSRVENDFDLEQEINMAVDKTKEFIKEVKDICYNDSQAKAILKAIATEIIDSI